MLCYECAIESLELILEYSSLLETEDFKRIVVGRERLSKYSYEFAEIALSPQERCHSEECSKTRVKMLIKWMKFDSYDPPRFALDACLDGLGGIGDTEDRERLCLVCLHDSQDALKDFQNTVWTNLPGIFQLGEWDTLENV